MMEMNTCFRILVIASLPFCTTDLHAQSKKDFMAIRQVLDDETLSWNKKDAKMYASHFSENGTFTNVLGMFFTGYDHFLKMHEHVFKTMFRGTVMQQQLVSIQFAGETIAVVETITTISDFSADGPPKGTSLDSKGSLNTRLLQTMLRSGSDWKIIAYHNVDIKAGIPVPQSKQSTDHE